MTEFTSSTAMPEKHFHNPFVGSQRNTKLKTAAGILIKRGTDIEKIRSLCQQVNTIKCEPPLDADEVEEIVVRAFKCTPLNAEVKENDLHEDGRDCKDVPSITVGVIRTSTADSDAVDRMSEATEVIATAMGTTPSEPTGSTITFAEPLISISSATIDVDSASVSPVSLTIKPQSTTADDESAEEVETAEDVVADYYFSTSTADDDLSSHDHSKLMDRLELLIDMVKIPDDYMAIRDQYCEISIELNRRKLWAPAYRPCLTIPKLKANWKPVHTLVLRDRIVIDCQWLHSKGYKNRSHEKQWRPMSNLKIPFPFELATEFAKREMKAEYRAEGIFGLTTRQQLEMRALQGKAVQAHVHALKQYQRIDGVRIANDREITTLAVNRWCEKFPRYESAREKYLAHAKARALLAIVTTSPTDIANLAGMIQGINPLSESTVRGLLKNMDRWQTELAP